MADYWAFGHFLKRTNQIIHCHIIKVERPVELTHLFLSVMSGTDVAVALFLKNYRKAG